ncbi:lisH domain-containing protein C1711.05-like [Pistacia vera]|uniref:lisH domain-containing protein C1711.05-like n=1 Tax=Pistacia vera TaxID=55513 RepID=UPI0012634456|nr:lisH domain-containing protein C1711.05-like [Pistacia vera]XP_031255772.1 lisH domain-containing protein C1711.05-like [Pistacia vera]
MNSNKSPICVNDLQKTLLSSQGIISFFDAPLMASKGEQNLLQAPCFIGLHDDDNNNNKKKHAIAKQEDHNWMIMHRDDDDHEDAYTNMSSSSSSSSLGDSSITNSHGSTSSSDLVDDASSSNSSSNSNNGPLFEFSDLMAQLPIKRGLSKFFQGKSQSFTSLSRVKSIEDLAKKESPYRKKMKTCKSYAGGLDSHKSYVLDPKATISKKSSRSSYSSLSFPGRRISFLANSRPPPAPVQKHF